MTKRTARKISRPTYLVRNGMGGSFTVTVLETLPANKARVRVSYPTADWDGYEFEAAMSALRPTGKRELVSA